MFYEDFRIGQSADLGQSPQFALCSLVPDEVLVRPRRWMLSRCIRRLL